MEAAYLKRTVGACLADGLAEVAAMRPSDPIEYLALWMLKYNQNMTQRARDGEIPVVRVEERKEIAVVPDSEAAPETPAEEEVTKVVPAEQKTPPPPPSMPRIDEVEEESNG